MTHDQFQIFYEAWGYIAPFITTLIEFFNTTLATLLTPTNWGENIPEWVNTLMSPIIELLNVVGVGDKTIFECMFGVGVVFFLTWGLVNFLKGD